MTLPADPAATYAIGDVHGCLDKLLALEELIVDDAREIEGVKLIVMLGDYVDRGPDSSRLVDHLIARPPQDFYRICLRGNHEDQLLKVLADPRQATAWMEFGGKQTMRSYGFDIEYLEERTGLKRQAIVRDFVSNFPPLHRTFLESLPLCLKTPRRFFVHAGARPGIGLDDQSERDLLWIRDTFLHHTGAPFDRMVVHGHTPQQSITVSPYRVGVDTGAYMGGPLSAVRFVGDTIRGLSIT